MWLILVKSSFLNIQENKKSMLLLLRSIVILCFILMSIMEGSCSAAEVTSISIDCNSLQERLNNIVGVNISRSEQDIERFLNEIGPGLFRIKCIIFKHGEGSYRLLSNIVKTIHAKGGKVILQLYGIPKDLSSNPDDLRVLSNGIPEFSKYPPRDYQAWRVTMKNIVKKLESNNVKIDYFEILGEPNIGSTWFGKGNVKTIQSFLEFYDQTAKALKEADPRAKIGGVGFALGRFPFDMDNPKHPMVKKTKIWIDSFLKYIKEFKAPLDFFSIHIYDIDARLFGEYSKGLKRYLLENSFDVPFFITEWNFDGGRKMDSRADGMYSASFVTAAMIEMLNANVDGQNFYMLSDMALPFGLFKKNGQPKPNYYAMKLLAGLDGKRIKVNHNDNDIYILAVKGEREVSVLLTYYIPSEEVKYEDTKKIILNIQHIPSKDYKVEVYGLTEKGIKLENTFNNRDGNFRYNTSLQAYGILLLKIKI